MKDKYMENERLSVLLFLCVALIYAFTYMTKNCYAAAMVLLVDEGVLTKTQTGTIGAAFYLVYAPFQIIGGAAADKYSPYKLIAIGLLGGAVANIIISFTSNYYVMIVVWSLNAAVQFGIWPSVFKIVSTKLSPVHRHNGVFYIMFSTSGGLVLSYIFAGFADSWRSNFEISSVTLIVCFVLWVVAGKYFDKKMVSEEIHSHGVAHLPEHKMPDKAKKAGFGRIMLRSGLIILLPAVIIRTVFEQGIQTVIPTMINESYDNVSPSFSSVLNLIPIFFGICGKTAMNFVYRRKHYNQSMAMGVLFLVLIPLLASMLLIGKINMWIILAIVSMVVFIAAAGSYIATFMAVPFTDYGFNGTAAGVLNAMASLGIVVGNYALTRIADGFSWTAVWIVLTVMSVAGCILCMIAFFPWRKFIKTEY
ncbi:MAG: MFS transporter [Clostridia bacterium]|nr:MFS transporter [Clostridia bacterium]